MGAVKPAQGILIMYPDEIVLPVLEGLIRVAPQKLASCPFQGGGLFVFIKLAEVVNMFSRLGNWPGRAMKKD